MFMSILLSFMLLAERNSLHASADESYLNYISTSIKELESGIPGNNYIHAGDYKLTLIVKESTGFTNISANIPYNTSKFSVVTGNNNKPVFTKGDAGDHLTFSVSNNTNHYLLGGLIGFSSMSTESPQIDDEIVSFYLRPTSNFNHNDNIADLIGKPNVLNIYVIDASNPYYDPDAPDHTPLPTSTSQEFTYTQVVNYSYRLGDVNGDGYVDAYDYQSILNLLLDNQTSVISTNTTAVDTSHGNYNSLYIMINGVNTLVLKVADVDYDNDIDSADAYILLDYYSTILSGLTWDGDIGNVIHTETSILTFTN